MPKQQSTDQVSLEQSSEWLERLRERNPADDEEFGRWLLASERHVHDFLLVSAIDEELRHMDVERRIPVEGRVPSSSSAQHTHGPSVKADPAPWWSWIAVAAAAALLAFVVIWPSAIRPFGRSADWQEYPTRPGEQSTVTLPDGSKVKLNARTQMSARISRGLRRVELVKGEALFDVTHDPSRPFTVDVGTALLEVRGTQFDVNRRPGEDGAIVAVIQGEVQVFSNTIASSIRRKLGADLRHSSLTQGQQARVGPGATVQLDPVADVHETASWSTGTFEFSKKTFLEMVPAFNRYNVQQIRILGHLSRDRPRTVTFKANDPKTFVNIIAAENGWDVEEHTNGDLVVSDPSNGARK
jgi:transmembrane sensor